VRESVTLYDTTLRDGAQTQGVDFSVEDKRIVAEALDRIGIHYIEGGWPGANPTDDAFFADPPALKRARFTAFGMTKRSGRSAANDPGLAALLSSRAPAICLVGKTWDYQVDIALGIPRGCFRGRSCLTCASVVWIRYMLSRNQEVAAVGAWPKAVASTSST